MSASTSFPLTIPVPIAQGGTAGTTAASARTNLSAAASGANADITSIASVAAVAFGGYTDLGFRFKSGGVQSSGMAETTDFGGLSIFWGSAAGGPWHWRTVGGTVPMVLNAVGNLTLIGDVQGALKTAANAVTGLVAGVLAATTNASIVIKDATGQAYRVPCII